MSNNSNLSNEPILNQVNNLLNGIQFTDEENSIIPYIDFIYDEDADPEITSLEFSYEVYFDKNFNVCSKESDNVAYELDVSYYYFKTRIHLIFYTDYTKNEFEKIQSTAPYPDKIEKVLDVIYKLVAIYVITKTKYVLNSFVNERMNINN